MPAAPVDYAFLSRRQLRRRAASGDPEDHYQLALAYLERAPIELEHAKEQMEKAAARGHVAAQAWLGLAEADPARARAWLERAAAQGHLEATIRLLDRMRRRLPGFAVDEAEARRWQRRAAEAGSAAAQYAEGLCCQPSDPEAAHAWMRRAAEHGHAAAAYALGELLRARGDAEAVRWYEAASAAHHADASWALRLMLRDGELVPRDYARARMYRVRAVEDGNPHAQLEVGGLDNVRKAAESGLVKAQYKLGVLLLDPEHAYDRRRRREGLAALQRAASQGYRPARRALAAALAPENQPAVAEITDEHAALRYLLDLLRSKGLRVRLFERGFESTLFTSPVTYAVDRPITLTLDELSPVLETLFGNDRASWPTAEKLTRASGIHPIQWVGFEHRPEAFDDGPDVVSGASRYDLG
ncbi:Hypothetical protein A7982_07279 [Minicystis rosea]|nr:Hypothetical protein A7982_07279 [Minicystis rosea]